MIRCPWRSSWTRSGSVSTARSSPPSSRAACAIARALVKQPQVLLCDEPTGALDYGTSKEMLALLQQVNERLGTTIVIVTHNEAISRMTQRTIMVRDGRVQSSSVNDAPVRAEDLSW